MRKILDNVVECNIPLNPELANMVFNSPMYFGEVQEPISIVNEKPKNITEVSLVSGVKSTYDYMVLNKKESSYIEFRDSENGNTIKIDIEEPIIRFIKSCIGVQLSPSILFSQAVTEYLVELTRNIKEEGNILLPLEDTKDDILKKVVTRDLNKLLISICKENNICYKEVNIVNSKKKRKKSNLNNLECLANMEAYNSLNISTKNH